MAKSVGYYLGQVPQLLLVPVGLVLLALPCFLRAWTDDAVSNKIWPPPDEKLIGRKIDRWSWRWLNPWFGNPEDGVSGRYALVWDDRGQLETYNPTGSRWKAYVWSAWRNSVDGLKYRFPQS